VIQSRNRQLHLWPEICDLLGSYTA